MSRLDRDHWADLMFPVASHTPIAPGAVAEELDSGRRVLIISKRDNDVYDCAYIGDIVDVAGDSEISALAADLEKATFDLYQLPEERLETVAPDRLTLDCFDAEVNQ